MADFEPLGVVPTRIVSGDKLPLRLDALSATYPTADYTLRFDARLASNSPITVTFDKSGGVHSGTLDFASALAGVWRYTIRATDSAANSRIVEDGSIKVFADPNAGNTQTHAERMLVALEAMLEGKATSDQQSYSIAGRTLTRMTVDEIMKWRSHYKAEVAAERSAGKGIGARRVTLARFS